MLAHTTLIEARLKELEEQGNLRRLPSDSDGSGLLDFSSNDYLGIAARLDLQKDFLEQIAASERWLLGASASRLLASRQNEFEELESTIGQAYGCGRKALLFGSGYHANTGLIPALADSTTTIVADKYVHASIIDGMRLSGAPFERFRHNDLNHLERLLAKVAASGKRALVVVESIYSMDGDSPDMEGLLTLKNRYPGTLLYVDEAHAIGVAGGGLGLGARHGESVDVTVGTFGKALASAGAYAVVSPTVRQWLVNTCRSLIFSTALPPLTALWNTYIFKRMLAMDAERSRLRSLGELLGAGGSHIQYVIVGEPRQTVALSQRLRSRGVLVLPIRRPTVPPGTDRLRISLSAAHRPEDVLLLKHLLGL